MMIGGDKAVVDRLDPIFAALAPGIGDIPRTEARQARDPRIEQGYIHAGPVWRRALRQDGPQRPSSTGLMQALRRGLRHF